jgi:hypothetical protein
MLHRVMSFGHVTGTSAQYGRQRELLNLVTVIRDPVASAPHLPDWIPGLEGYKGRTQVAVEEYAQQLYGTMVLPGMEYSYGSRLHGMDTPGRKVVVRSGDLVLYDGEVCSVGTCRRPPGHRGGHDQFDEPRSADVVPLHLDYSNSQIAALDHLLQIASDGREIFLTPWIPSLDAGRPSGRPCLVGAWFRRTPPDGALNLTVMFRSHDMFRGYPMNLAAVCLWLAETAERHDFPVGTVTCLSTSAHIYERDWEAADALIDKYRFWKTPDLDLDRRSLWRVELASDKGIERRRLRAIATHPKTHKIIATFEGKTAAALRRKIERSGLLQSIGGALWLGAELQRFEGLRS